MFSPLVGPLLSRPVAVPRPARARKRGPAGPERLVRRIRTSEIGHGAVIDGPFGPRRMVYADYTASGRSLDFV